VLEFALPMNQGDPMKFIYPAALWAVLAICVSVPARAASTWTEGVNYFLIEPAHPTSLPPGKVEVTEVFSFACPACNMFQPTMQQLKKTLPPNAVVDYLHAAFNTAEDWPMFQLAFITAQALGVEEQTHDAMYDAVWKGGDLSVIDTSTRGLKSHMPTIEDAAKFYNQRAGVPVEKFLATAKSFSVDIKVRTANDLIMAYRVDGTPTIIVNGKYRVGIASAGGTEKLVELVKYLVAKESK
jgi:thiol:disulfide interchange protein DsbA